MHSGRYTFLYAPQAVKVDSASHNSKSSLQKAKVHHPDVKQKDRDSSHFARILVAYQVLSNSRQRELYDLSLRSSSSTVNAAASEGARWNKANGFLEQDGLPGRPSLPHSPVLDRLTS